MDCELEHYPRLIYYRGAAARTIVIILYANRVAGMEGLGGGLVRAVRAAESSGGRFVSH